MKYCASFSCLPFLPNEEKTQIKETKLERLAAEIIPLLDKGKSYTIAVDYSEKPVYRYDFDGSPQTPLLRGTWTLSVEPVKTVIVEVPKIESPHYKLPVTDSLKERAAAAWNYFRGKGEIS